MICKWTKPWFTSRHPWLHRFLMACEIIPKARQCEPWVHALSPKLPFLLGSPLFLDPQAWKSSSESSSSSLPLSHTNSPSRTLHKSAQVWPLAPPHTKVPLTWCSLHFHLLSVRSTNNMPQILPSITSLLWSWLRLSSIPQIKSQSWRGLRSLGNFSPISQTSSSILEDKAEGKKWEMWWEKNGI